MTTSRRTFLGLVVVLVTAPFVALRAKRKRPPVRMELTKSFLLEDGSRIVWREAPWKDTGEVVRVVGWKNEPEDHGPILEWNPTKGDPG